MISHRKFAVGCLMLAMTVVVASNVFGGEPQPQILIANPNYDFGRLFEAETYTHVFQVKNTGESELKIARVKPG
ncbi:MAG: hypothetical protein O7D32_03290 [bacterium]|nr:hypothetical protein [bacterium]